MLISDSLFSARLVLKKILEIVNDEERQCAYLAVQLLDCLMVNCGYPIRYLMTRKENLNLLVLKFPPSPNVLFLAEENDF